MKNHRSYPLAAFQKIIHYLKRGYNPSYLGNISTEIGYSVESTEDMLKQLALLEGSVRELSTEQKRARNVSVIGVMYELVEKR